MPRARATAAARPHPHEQHLRPQAKSELRADVMGAPEGGSTRASPWLHRVRGPAASPGGSISGESGAALAESRLAAVESAQIARDGEMRKWSEAHARLLELLVSESLSGRWVGAVSGASSDWDASGALLVEWQAQSANSHPECFGWLAGSHELTVAEPGLYELSAGLWPGLASRAEVRVNSTPAIELAKPALVGAASAGGGGGGSMLRMGAAEIAGLCVVCVVALPPRAVLSLAAQGATPHSRAFLGLRKL